MSILDIAESIAERLEQHQTPENTSFANGALGNALFFLALAQARSTERWASAAHQSIKLAATGGRPMLAGLFSGLAGLLYVAAYAARIDARYGALRDQCAKALVASGATTPPLKKAARAKEYDLISGVAGIHAALIYAGEHAAARGTRAYLEWLLADEDRWKCEHEIVAERGAANDLGVAHGVAGMLSVLAADDDVESQTLEHVAEYLWEKRVPGTMLWPSSIGLHAPEPSRAAWCYGNPGIAIAFLRVAQRIQSASMRERARSALHALLDAPRESWGQIDFALCHGAAGNGLILDTAARALDDEGVGACASELSDELVSAYDDAIPLGYRNWDNVRNCWTDDASLLTGSAGIGLALVTLCADVDASWMGSFAIGKPLAIATGAAS